MSERAKSGRPRVAIVGAGIAGAAAAATLRGDGIELVVFDKGRSPGGRLSTRRRTVAGADVAFDHGAPVLGGRAPRFDVACAALMAEGTLVPWPDGGSPIAVPTMNAIVKALLADVDVRVSETVRALEDTPAGWVVRSDDDRSGPFDAVVVTVPAPQAVPLLADHDGVLAAAADGAVYRPCWTGMFAFATALPPAPSGADLAPHGIERIVRDGDKPGRSGATLVLHADEPWSRARLEDDAGAIVRHFQAVLAGAGLPEPSLSMAHRWRFAHVSVPSPPHAPVAAGRIAVAGDWTRGPTVADAYESGVLTAEAIRDRL